MLSEQEKAQKREERFNREVEKFKANIAIPRPGTSGMQTADLPVLKKHGIELSDVLYLPLAALADNPLNDYPPLPEDELEELTVDIKEKGILVPLIAKLDGTLVCGHNRKRAGILAGLERGPVQQILSSLTPELERDIMKSENDRRRGGRWSKEQKEAFVRQQFAAEIATDNRGLNRRDVRKFNELSHIGSTDLAKKIEKQSRGKITSGTAKRIVADLRKKAPKKPDSEKTRLPGGDKRRGEKLAVRLKTTRQLIAILEKKLTEARAEERRILATMG